MKILLISYSDYEYDGRLRSLINVFSEIGNLHSFIKNGPEHKNITLCNKNYLRFIKSSLLFYEKNKPFDVIVLDNRKATIPGLLIKETNESQFIIQDSRELYLMNEAESIISKIGCFFEKIMSKKADIVICANQYRASIMKEKYNLNKLPLVYENLRELQYESVEELEKAKIKLSKYIIDNETRIVSTSGCSVKRTNDILVRNISKVKGNCRLFLVGKSDTKDIKIINDIVNSSNLKNVCIINQLNQTELKYLISKSHIGIVNYGQYDTNNKYCASGKVYEFIFENIPVVCTTNPPLLDLCNKYGVGVTDDLYYNGINTIFDNYNLYKENIKQFKEHFSTRNNDDRIIKDLENLIR